MKRTFQFDFKAGEFVMKNGVPIEVNGQEALKLWIEKCLRTQLGRYKIYENKIYGANIEDLVIGTTYGAGFTSAELKREIENALMQNEDIKGVTAISLNRTKDVLSVDITVTTAYGEGVKYTYDA